jgi:serine/threonine protein kinase
MAEIPTADWSWIDAAAQRFERAWKDGERPRIEEFLIKVPEPQWPPLLQELMRVEGELRRRAGEEPSAEEYRQRFPEHQSVITAVFESSLVASTVADQAEPVRSTRATSASLPLANSLPPELANHSDYEIVRELGGGGMGVVYLAHNRLMARDEVLKVMGQHIVGQPGVLDRFLREIRAVAKLRHPNIVSAYSAFRCGGSLVFAMEYVEGLDLCRMVKAKGPMPIGHACYFVHQAALGLQHAHEAGMVHRDIKPANLMLSRQRNRAVIKVLDFGLSKAVSEQNASELAIGVPNLPMDFGEHLTRTGEMLGTPDFIAPEQIIDSQKADSRADIYSLGCTLYYLLSGHAPYPDLPLQDVLKAHRSRDARPLEEVRAEVHAELSMLVARMMAKDPASRFPEPAEVAVALSPFFKKQPVVLGTKYLGAPQAARLATGCVPAESTEPDPRASPPPSQPKETGIESNWRGLFEGRDTEDDPAEVAPSAEASRRLPRWIRTVRPAAAGLAAILLGIVIVAITPKEGRIKEPAYRKARQERTGRGPVLQPTSDEGVEVARTISISKPGSGGAPRSPADVAGDNQDGQAVLSAPPKGTTPAESGNRTTTVAAASLKFLEIASFNLPSPVIQSRFLPDGRHLVCETGPADRAVWLADLTDPKGTVRLKGPDKSWVQLALSSDGRLAVFACGDGSVWSWELGTGKLRRLRLEGGSITALALSPDDHLIAYVSHETIQVLAVATALKVKSFPGRERSPIRKIAFCPYGRRIVSTHADHKFRVWDVATGRPIQPFIQQSDRVTDFAIFSGGRRILTSCLDGTIGMWDLKTGRQLGSLNKVVARDGTVVAISADDGRVLVGTDKTVWLWDLNSGKVLKQIELLKKVVHVALSPDGLHGLASTDETLQVWVMPPGLKNPGFEAALEGWTRNYDDPRLQVAFDTIVKREGGQALRVTSTEPSDRGFYQEVMLKPHQWYRFSGWVRTRGLDPHGSPVYGTFQIQLPEGRGTIARGTNHGGDTEWTEVPITFQAPAGGLTRFCVFFVGFGKGTGTAWFDNLTVVEISGSPR